MEAAKKQAELFTISRAAEFHDVAYTTICNAIRDGLLKTREIGGVTFISRFELARWKPRPAHRPRKLVSAKKRKRA